ncbi:MAG: hypothetical protein A3D67_03385 [Candidatus Lloydbacteria bacterium RIFCSPHIGHO2_02_FULL_51_22]|uniref:Uncharacterized protein n=3 Tax=Candidatus Lloydiibacteriota TaxID=1817910 RepID=A0A1G2DEM1_9BACT|nr:MAG: hypothetical protein A3D67_03385 [Candidatus Lloydbacteria bacterium RIFCSPHIGHO2_02_FULL_51_22]OGZ14044.1 MAG: hypothetical protein A3J08_03910 [Candidatus Lloydbacteria bacterium RIFCSPLOWO2_02_FULL_51_11]OGZ16887.1 MAG: hypothetical protein A3G11_01465 [Candidatus Lloydbacteria bacterium RIFCSPLOWO2_12_FULL_51_9]
MAANWHHAYERKLKRLPRFAAFEQIVNCIWKYGILAYFSPTSPRYFMCRGANETPVWRRGDARLYWRILYAAHGAIFAHRMSWSLSGESIITGPVAMACKYIRGEDPFMRATEAIVRRAEKELKSLGKIPHHIPFGAKGVYKGIHVVVERHGNYGTIVLNVDGEQYQGEERYKAWCRLSEVTNYHANLVEPWGLDPATFTTEKDTAAAHS